MKILLWGVAAVLFVAVIATTGSLYWLFFYSRDLPDLASLARFAPESSAIAVDPCSGTSIPVVPSSAISRNVRNAVHVAEGKDERLAVQISRGAFCGRSMKNLTRDVLEYKAALQLRRRFTSDQLLTIYLTRAGFGRDLIGVESASLHYCGKHTSDLDIAEASLIAA
jgi:membrane carboxypeptidase/penicillin-binding protein